MRVREHGRSVWMPIARSLRRSDYWQKVENSRNNLYEIFFITCSKYHKYRSLGGRPFGSSRPDQRSGTSGRRICRRWYVSQSSLITNTLWNTLRVCPILSLSVSTAVGVYDFRQLQLRSAAGSTPQGLSSPTGCCWFTRADRLSCSSRRSYIPATVHFMKYPVRKMALISGRGVSK